MTSQAVMKRYLLALAKQPKQKNNLELQKIAVAIQKFKSLDATTQEKINKVVEKAYKVAKDAGISAKKTPSKTTPTAKPKPTAPSGDLKAILKELKTKLGAERFANATKYRKQGEMVSTTIEKDIQIPALKKGKRIVRKKGYTTNGVGRFKNKVGSVYYENRANRIDENQPSQIRKYKLADGGQTSKIVREGSELLGYEPYFEKNVAIASIDDSKKIVRPTWGYFPNHPLSKKAIAWAKKNGYKYISDGIQILADGGDVSKTDYDWNYNKIIPRMDDDGFYLEGYEPYFRKYVTIATIDESTKVVSPTHGYYPNHPLAKKAIAWAKKNGLQYIADGKKYAEGGLTEHGLQLTDTIIEDFGDNEIGVRNANGDFHRVNLDEGKRFAKGGKLKEVEYPIAYIDVLQSKPSLFTKVRKTLEKYGIEIDNSKNFHTKGYAEELYGENYNGEEIYTIVCDIRDASNPIELEKEIDNLGKKYSGVSVVYHKNDEYAKGGEVSKTDSIHLEKLLKLLLEVRTAILNDIQKSDLEIYSKKVASNSVNNYLDAFVAKLYGDSEGAQSGEMNNKYAYGDEPYTYTNDFGVDQEDFIKLVDVYHSTNPLNQVDRITERLTYREFASKYGEETLDAVIEYIQKVHDYHNKYAKGGTMNSPMKSAKSKNRMTLEEDEDTNEFIRKSWEGKNIDDYVMYSDRYAKGGKLKDYPYMIHLAIQNTRTTSEMIVALFKSKGDALLCVRALQEKAPSNFKYSMKESSKYADGGNVRELTKAEKEQAEKEIREAWEGKNIDDYVMYSDRYKRGGKMAKGGEVEKPLSYYKYETPKVKIAWRGKIQPFGMFKSAEEAMMVIEKKSNGIKSEINEYSIVTPDKTIHLGKEYAIRYAKGGTTKRITRKSC